jgi:hypothetical protein
MLDDRPKMNEANWGLERETYSPHVNDDMPHFVEYTP